MLNLRCAWGKVLPEWAGMCRLDPKAHPMEESAKALINQVVRRAGVPWSVALTSDPSGHTEEDPGDKTKWQGGGAGRKRSG